MIKNFENFIKIQRLGNGSTQWQKKYANGETARTVVDNKGVTREMVRQAFKAQESGLAIGCFQKSDLGKWMM